MHLPEGGCYMKHFLSKYFWVNGYLDQREYWLSIVLLAALLAMQLLLQFKVSNAWLAVSAREACSVNLDSMKSLSWGWFLIFPSAKRIRGIGHPGLWVLCPFVNIWFMLIGAFTNKASENTSVGETSSAWVYGSIVLGCYVFLAVIVFFVSFQSAQISALQKVIPIAASQSNERAKISERMQAITTEMHLSQPLSQPQITAYTDSIDTAIGLSKRSFKLGQYAQDTILALLHMAKTPEQIAEVSDFLKTEAKMNVDILPRFSRHFLLLSEATIAYWQARREYYQAILDGQSEHTRQYLLSRWNSLEVVALTEQEKLLALQTQLQVGTK